MGRLYLESGERATLVIGVDPGPTPGICALLWVGQALEDFRVLQINAPGCLGAIRWLSSSYAQRGVMVDAIAVERFVVGRRSVVSSSRDAGQITRDMVGAISAYGQSQVKLRSAAEVKPWATDERLKKAGLLSAVLGMPHARDAVRHALFTAVADCGVVDPLSSKGGKT